MLHDTKLKPSAICISFKASNEGAKWNSDGGLVLVLAAFLQEVAGSCMQSAYLCDASDLGHVLECA